MRIASAVSRTPGRLKTIMAVAFLLLFGAIVYYPHHFITNSNVSCALLKPTSRQHIPPRCWDEAMMEERALSRSLTAGSHLAAVSKFLKLVVAQKEKTKPAKGKPKPGDKEVRVLELSFAVDDVMGLGMSMVPSTRIEVLHKNQVGWVEGYHKLLYSKVFREMKQLGAVKAFVKSEGKKTSTNNFQSFDMRMTPSSFLKLMEHTPQVEGKQYDVVVSFNVLEYVFDLEQVAAELFEHTVPGGYNYHLVDTRANGPNPENTLDHLLYDDQAYARMFWTGILNDRLIGNRLRPDHIRLAFENAGFVQCTVAVLEKTSYEYLDMVRPLLQATGGSTFRDYEEEELLDLVSVHVFYRTIHPVDVQRRACHSNLWNFNLGYPPPVQTSRKQNLHPVPAEPAEPEEHVDHS